MIVREIIDRVKFGYSRGIPSDDMNYSDRYLYNLIISARSILLSQKSKKGQKISQWNFQTIPCIRMEKVPLYECPGIQTKSRFILKSKKKLPKPLTNLKKHLIQSITSIDGETTFGKETTWTNKKYQQYNKFTSKSVSYLIQNGYLYLSSETFPEMVSVTGLFENPIEAALFNDCSEVSPCYSYLDLEFPIDEDIIDTLVEVVSKGLGGEFLRQTEDKTNNSIDETNDRSRS